MMSGMERERLSVFINSFEADQDPFLARLEQEAADNHIPVIRHEMISFLRIFLELRKPVRILEVGTATGFSALVMAKYTSPGCRIDTIEKDPDRIRSAKEHFRESGQADRINLLEGDAAQILPALLPDRAETYDMIFMDAAKAQYIRFLPDIVALLSPGGVLISDNVLQEGDLLQSHFLVQRRDRTIYKRMREYLYALKHHDRLITSIIPIGDGAAVSIKPETKRQSQ